MSKTSKKTRYYDCVCGRKVPLDGIKVMAHNKPGTSEPCTEGAKSVLTPAMQVTSEKVERLLANAQPAMVQIKCVFPPCTTPVMVKAPPPGVAVGTPQHMTTLGGIPMCPRHALWLQFHVWATINVKLQPQQTKGGLITPGHQAFQPTLNKPSGGP